MAVVRIYSDMSAVLPRLPAWGLWVLAKTQSNESSSALLRIMTNAATGWCPAPSPGIRRAGPAPEREKPPAAAVTAVVLLANHAVDELDWERVALSPDSGLMLAELREARRVL